MGDQPLLLGIDLGTSSAKAVLAHLDGTVAGSGAAAYAIRRPVPDQAEQETDDWWVALVQATRRALGNAAQHVNRPEHDVIGIALSGQMHGTVLVGRKHRAIVPAIIWSDQRSGIEAQAITDEIGADRLRQLVGGPLASGFQAATVRWLAAHAPDLLERTSWILCPKDYVRLRLTGEFATDPSDGSGTGLFGLRDRRWSPDLVAAAGTSTDMLPTVGQSTEVAGGLLAGAADELGLVAGTPVVIGGADTPAGLLGSGIIHPNAFLLTISSGGQLTIPIARPDVDPSGRSHTFCSVLPLAAGQAGWYRMAAVLSAGLALQWVRDSVLGLAGANAYEEMLGWIDDVPVGSRGLVFLPYLAGERNPHLDPDARGVLLGLTATHGRPEIVRAVVEGITLGCFDAAQTLWEATGPPDWIVVAGGGGRSARWRQVLADVFGRPVRHLQTEEQAAAGASLLAGAGVGAFDIAEAATRWARLGSTTEPDPARHARYRSVYEIFRDGYPRLSSDFGRLKAISDDAAERQPTSPTTAAAAP